MKLPAKLAALCALSTLSFTAPRSFATVTITNVIGASNYNITNTSTTATVVTPTIWGGTSGTACNPADSYSTCNSCTTSTTCTLSDGTTPSTTQDGSPLCACNTTRIVDSGLLRIEFTSSTATSGLPVIAPTDTTNGSTITFTAGPAVTAANQTTYVDVRWSDLCSRLGLTTSGSGVCDGTGIGKSFNVGVSTAGTGNSFSSGDDIVAVTINVVRETSNTADDCSTTGTICGFQAYPGDTKAYILNPTTSSGFPSLTSGAQAQAIRVFPSELGFDHANAVEVPEPADLEVDLDNSSSDEVDITSHVVDHLANGTTYYFRAAIVDQANNVFNFTSDANIEHDYDSATGQYGGCGSDLSNPSADCQYRATPDAVYGLLTKDLNCFITTAAYGSSMAPKVNTFRQFRNRFLVPTQLGRKLIFAYYHYGPYAARWIAPRDWARAMTRTFLWPAWAFAWMSLQWGIPGALAAIFSMTALLSTLGLFWLSRRNFFESK